MNTRNTGLYRIEGVGSEIESIDYLDLGEAAAWTSW